MGRRKSWKQEQQDEQKIAHTQIYTQDGYTKRVREIQKRERKRPERTIFPLFLGIVLAYTKKE